MLSSSWPGPRKGSQQRHGGVKMRLSTEKRLQNVNCLLRLLMEDVGSRWIRMALVNPQAEKYRSVRETTWEDLRSLHLTQDAKGGLLLTGQGWEAGLRAIGKDAAHTRARVQRIYRALKSAVERRSDPATFSPVKIGEVARQAAMPAGFVANAIDAGLLESWLNRRGATWAPGSDGRMILVPVDFRAENAIDTPAPLPRHRPNHDSRDVRPPL